MKTQQSKVTPARAKRTSSAKLVTKKLGKRPQAKAAVSVSQKSNFVAAVAKRKAPSLAQTQVESDGDLFKFIGTGPAEGVYMQLAAGPKLLCPPLKPMGHAVDPDGSNPAMLLKLRNRLDGVADIEIPIDEFKSPKALLGTLVKKGLAIDHELTGTRAEAIHMYLRATVPDKTWLRVKHDGWLVLPDGSDGYVLGEELYCGGKPYNVAPARKQKVSAQKKGELKAWLRLSKPLGDDIIAVMMVCAGFSSTLLYPLHRDATCVVITGLSGIGKSTILKLVSALFSNPSNMVTWEATANGLEAATKKFQHKPFVIDEIGQGSAQVFAKAAYRLTNASGKLRADTSGVLVENERNVSVVLSAGEESPIAMMMAAGIDVKAGQRARLLCVPVSEKDGVWSTVKGYGSGAEKSKQITVALTQCYGVSGEAFCKCVANRVSSLSADYAASAAKLREQITAGIEFTADDGVVDRVLENFVLFAFAGMLAIDAGAVAWSQQQVVYAMQRGFSLWHAEHQNSRPVTEDEIMNQVSLFFQSERGTKFKPFDQFGDSHSGVVAGYEYTPRGGGEPLFLVYPAYFESKVCGDLDKNAVIAQLRSRGLLVSGSRGVPTKQFHLPGTDNRSASFYAIKQSVLLG